MSQKSKACCAVALPDNARRAADWKRWRNQRHLIWQRRLGEIFDPRAAEAEVFDNDRHLGRSGDDERPVPKQRASRRSIANLFHKRRCGLRPKPADTLTQRAITRGRARFPKHVVMPSSQKVLHAKSFTAFLSSHRRRAGMPRIVNARAEKARVHARSGYFSQPRTPVDSLTKRGDLFVLGCGLARVAA
jgi:hypothetical protein